jgi:predicted nucleotidyltransferase
MIPEKQINDFVNRLREAAGKNLQSVILYGSAASGEFHPEFSDLNLLCILQDASFPALNGLAPAIEWWTRQKFPPPLVLTLEEMKRSADVFAIEFLDMRAKHRVLLGDDVLADLHIPMHLHGAQVEYELREKLLLLRRGLLLAAGKESRQWDLMLRSLPAITTLFRHALITLGAPAVSSKREATQQLSTRIHFDPSAFLQLLDVREHKADRKQFNVTDLFTRYLAAVEQVTAAVDTMLDSSQSTGPHSS